MDCQKIQLEYDRIYSYFKTTGEQFDLLEWNGKILNVWNKNKIIEIYKYKELKSICRLGLNDPKNYNSIELVKSGRFKIK